MKAARIHRFGPPDVIVMDDMPRPAGRGTTVSARSECRGGRDSFAANALNKSGTVAERCLFVRLGPRVVALPP